MPAKHTHLSRDDKVCVRETLYPVGDCLVDQVDCCVIIDPEHPFGALIEGVKCHAHLLEVHRVGVKNTLASTLISISVGPRPLRISCHERLILRSVGKLDERHVRPDRRAAEVQRWRHERAVRSHHHRRGQRVQATWLSTHEIIHAAQRSELYGVPKARRPVATAGQHSPWFCIDVHEK